MVTDANNLDRLHTLLVDWIENDPVFSSGYTSKKKSLSKQLLQFENDVASLTGPAADVLLYRGYDLRKGQRLQDGSLSIQPRSSDLIESWTTDAAWAFQHADQFESGIVIRKLASELDIFIDVDAFARTVDAEDLDLEGEILVRCGQLSVPADDWTWSEVDFPKEAEPSVRACN
ncbi:hypothetical protein ACXHXG_20645 [Rhizobium sp. LEGMi198b]